MDLHDFDDVAQNYDRYQPVLSGGGDAGLEDFHLELARDHGQHGILDIACGTGATLLPFINAGFRVTGVDISAAMLAVLQGKLALLPGEVQARARLVCADMKSFSLPKQASLAVIPRSGFIHLLTPADQEAALKNIHRHLLPGGILSFNTFDPHYGAVAGNIKGSSPQPNLRAEYTNRNGLTERIWNVSEYDPLTQIIEGRWIFEELNAQGEVETRRERPLHVRWSFESETRHLLRLCGFEILDVYSSYRKAPRAYGAALLWVTRKV
jgi:ubiquinone/menaquinone biosynthesis C-methylase UbiE